MTQLPGQKEQPRPAFVDEERGLGPLGRGRGQPPRAPEVLRATRGAGHTALAPTGVTGYDPSLGSGLVFARHLQPAVKVLTSASKATDGSLAEQAIENKRKSKGGFFSASDSAWQAVSKGQLGSKGLGVDEEATGTLESPRCLVSDACGLLGKWMDGQRGSTKTCHPVSMGENKVSVKNSGLEFLCFCFG